MVDRVVGRPHGKTGPVSVSTQTRSVTGMVLSPEMGCGGGTCV